jgi:hypothetical protein
LKQKGLHAFLLTVESSLPDVMNSNQTEKINVTFSQAVSILLPYTWHHLKEQLITVIPVCLYLALFQWVILQHGLTRITWIVAGILVVVLGLFFFLEGVRISLAPVGEIIGDTLPKRCSLSVLLLFAFVLGVVGAFGEPVIGSLQIAGTGVDPQKAPLLYELLVRHPIYLTIVISLGVGVAVTVGTLRFLYGWSLKPIILPIVGLSVVATILCSQRHELSSAVGLAWDTGAVIVGPVLCPLVLALGMGIFRATGKSDSGMAGFGMVGLISVMPIISVILMTYVLYLIGVETGAAAPELPAATGKPSILQIFVDSLFMAVRAIAPVFVFLWFFMRYKLREPGIPLSQYLLGMGFTIIGLFLFNSGLSVGLAELGNQVGNQLPAAFHPPQTSLYPSPIGKIIVVVFGVILGYGATLAEPAFKILGQQVEDVTQGAFKKWLFSQAVAIGVGVGAGLGIFSTVYYVNLIHLLMPPYVVLFILTLVSKEEYVNIAWDGGAVTTGPVTVPLKIAIGIALSQATGFAEGFGIIALASAYPVMNILLLGLYVRYAENKLAKLRQEETHA